MLTIFIQDKPLYLIADKKQIPVGKYTDNEMSIGNEADELKIKEVLEQMESGDVKAGFILGEVAKTLEIIKNIWKPVLAAGGFVYTSADDVLLIYRRGKWDLPKGKLDEGEDLETCALREIEEETGAKDLNIISPLHVSYHHYKEKGVHIIKESHWFLVYTKTAAELQAQTAEDIEICKWVKARQVTKYTPYMHTSLAEVVQKGLVAVKKN